MSWGTCYNGSNNIHFDYPALMSDGRIYTDWNPSCKKNKELIKQNNIQTNFEYRKYLTNNAKSIMNNNTKEACDQCGVCYYGHPYSTNSNRYLYKSINNTHQPYGYENSDLKNIYLSRQQLQSRLTAPIMSQQESLTLPRAN